MSNQSLRQNEIRIEVITEGEKPYSEVYSVDKGSIIIGRSHDVDITLEDTFVSKQHCTIKFSTNAIMLEDMGSRNGTFVNGRKANALELMSGDKIQIGKTTVIVRLPERAVAAFDGKTREFDSVDTGEFSEDELTGEDRVVERTHQSETPAVSARPVKKTPPGKKDSEIPQTSPKIADDDYPVLKNEITGGFKPSAEPAYYEEDDEDDDDEVEGTTYFPIITKILSSDKQKTAGVSKGYGDERVEVIKSRGDLIIDVDEVTSGGKYGIDVEDKKFKFIHYGRPGECQLNLHTSFSGSIYSGGQRTPLDKLLSYDKHGRAKYPLKRGELGEIEVGARKYFVRFVDSPGVPPEAAGKPKYPEMAKPVGYSSVIHVLLLLVMSLLALIKTGNDSIAQQDEDRFVKLDIKDLEPKEPTPIPTATPVDTPAPKPIAEKPVPIKSPKKIKIQQKPVKLIGVKASRRVGGGGGGGGDVNVAAMGALASLGGLTTDTNSASNVVKAVSNLDAVRAPRGTESSFAVSSLIGKSSSGDAKIVRISGPNTRVGGINKDGGALGRIGGLGIGRGGGIKGRGVGGIVVGDVPQFDIGIKGSLSRQQVMEVVNKHVAEISYCYEKALFDEPTLEGKLLMFWEIGGEGRVLDVRIKSASLRSNNVNRCVMSNIKTWIFPKPKGGGVVQVTFPFVFNAASF